MGGYANKFTYTGSGSSDNNFIFGHANEVSQNDSSKNVKASIAFGYQNKIEPKSSASWVYLIGNNNTHAPLNSSETGGCAAFGAKLKPIKGHYMYGCNNKTPVLTDAHLVLASGTTSSSATAIEASSSQCKICLPLQLATDTTEVNAITPALSSPASVDDKTLVTKSHLGATLPMTHLAGAITGLDESSFPLDFTSYWAAARATDANMRISLRINGSCYSKSLYNCLAVDGSFECYRSSYDSGTQTTTFSRYRFGWDYANKALNLTGSMSWELSDAGTISNVTHGLTGLVITIYQIETY